MDEQPRSPDPADPDSLLAMLPDPEPYPVPGSTQGAGHPLTEERLAEAEATLGLLSETVSRLAATVGRIAEQSPGLAPTAAPATGPASDDELVEWVCQLVDRYGVGHVIPRCWAEHPRLVDELDALRLGWLGAVAPGRPGLDALVWHDHLRRFLADAAGYNRQCRIEHKASTLRPASETHMPRAAPSGLGAGRPGAGASSGEAP